MDDDAKVMFAVGGTILIGVILFIGLIVGGDYLWESKISCPAFGQSVERPVKYSLIGGGCFVEAPNGQWVHSSNYWSSPPNT